MPMGYGCPGSAAACWLNRNGYPTSPRRIRITVNRYLVPDSSGRLPDPGETFTRRVRRAATTVLGNSDIGRQVRELCDVHDAARISLTTHRSASGLVVAFVGATGQGKSWLLRQFVADPHAVAAIPSGNNLNEATERVIWVGSSPPADLDHRQERFVHCSSDRLHALGVPYVMVDTPGSTDDRRTIADIARHALSLAGILILVTRRDQMRSGVVNSLALACEGSIVIPVINAIRTRDESLSADSDSLIARIRHAAPESEVSPAVWIDDFTISDRSESEVSRTALTEIAQRVAMQMERTGGPETRLSARLAAIEARFRTDLEHLLGDQLPALTTAVDRLREAADALPREIAQSLIGGGPPLRAAVRSRLRANLLTDTEAIWFPYRTILGGLSLTSGAWDRVVLSLAGSLPSLIGAAWTSARNISSDASGNRDIRDGLKRRAAAIVADRLGPLTARFRAELKRLHGQSAGESASSTVLARGDGYVLETDEGVIGATPRAVSADLAGIDVLQEESQRIFDDEVQRVAVSGRFSLFCALMGTLLFWMLMAGPIVALYRSYGDASFGALRSFSGDLTAFPQPNASMLLTSLLLSILPTAIFAMLVISWAQGRWRIDRAESRIRENHQVTINRLQQERVLRLRWDDPLLADAEFLLSVDNHSKGYEA